MTIYIRNWPTICVIYILPLLPVAAVQAILAAQGKTAWANIVLLIQSLGTILVSVALVVVVSNVCIGLNDPAASVMA